ncbi:hypothetical protein K9M74_03075 [Candidatus Woesearchaeota archaeon]|nr:hypothetical protein [Candidatus Woesearchaeota archaeon]
MRTKNLIAIMAVATIGLGSCKVGNYSQRDSKKDSQSVVQKTDVTKKPTPYHLNGSKKSVPTISQSREDLLKKISFYKDKENHYLSTIDNLYKSIDSLELVITDIKKENQSLELIADEFNKIKPDYDYLLDRYTNLSNRLENKISRYISENN